MLQNGSAAPLFSLYSSVDKKVSLDDFKGKRIVLVFYPADWSPVCGDQLVLYNEMEEIFEQLNAQVLGISVDGKWCHASYSEQRGFTFPLLADFEPKGAVAKMYQAYNEQTGECHRALYVLDEARIIRWSYLSPVEVNPGADGILEALEKLPVINNQ